MFGHRFHLRYHIGCVTTSCHRNLKIERSGTLLKSAMPSAAELWVLSLSRLYDMDLPLKIMMLSLRTCALSKSSLF